MGINITATCDNCGEQVYNCEDIDISGAQATVMEAKSELETHECEEEMQDD